MNTKDPAVSQAVVGRPTDKPRLSAAQIAILTYAEPYGNSVATHWFRTNMTTPGATTRMAYREIQKLVALGLMSGVSHGGKNRWWRITEAGKTALAEARK